MATDGFEMLIEALDELAADDIVGVAQRDAIVALDKAKARLDAELSRRLAELDRSSEHQALGYRSPAGFLMGRLRCARHEAYRRVRVARHAEEMPEISALWARGAVTTGHVEAATSIRHSAHADELFAEFEGSLARIAAVAQPEDVADSGRAWRDALDDHLDRDGAQTIAGEQRERQVATFARSIDDLGFLRAAFDPEAATIVGRSIDLAYERGHRAGDPRSPQRQRADAIVEICTAYMAGSPRTGNRPHVLVVTDAATLAGAAVGRAHSSDGTRLSPSTVRRIACDAFVQQILVGAGTVPLAMGRAARLFTPDQHRAMVVRDLGCRGPDCDVGPDRCESHHLAEWSAGQGPTDLDNGALFCRGHCHRRLHDGGWRVSGNANGRLEFHDRAGNLLGHSEPRTPPAAIVTKRGAQRAREDDRARERVAALAGELRQRRATAR